MLCHVSIVVALSVGFAPAPVYRDRPLTPREQAALLEAVREEMRAALREREKAEPTADADKIFRRKSRLAAQRLDRLHATMPESGALRATVGLAAALAWGRAGEPTKAVRYYEDVAERAPHPDTRLGGLLGASGCYLRLRRTDQAAKAMERVTREVASLDPTQRKVWEMELRAIRREQQVP
jgi:hypothetical protein